MKNRACSSWQVTATVLMLAQCQESVPTWHQLDELCEQYTLFAGTACDVRASDDHHHHDSPFRMAAQSSLESLDENEIIFMDAHLAVGITDTGLTPRDHAVDTSLVSSSWTDNIT